MKPRARKPAPAAARRRGRVSVKALVHGTALAAALGLSALSAVTYMRQNAEVKRTPAVRRELSLDAVDLARARLNQGETSSIHRARSLEAEARIEAREKYDRGEGSYPNRQGKPIYEPSLWYKFERYGDMSERDLKQLMNTAEKVVDDLVRAGMTREKATEIAGNPRWGQINEILRYAKPESFPRAWERLKPQLTEAEVKRVEKEIVGTYNEIQSYLNNRDVQIRAEGKWKKRGAWVAGIIALAEAAYLARYFIRRRRNR